MLKDPTGLILIIVGLLFLIKPLVVGFINLKNKLNGVQTAISPMTLWYYRLSGVIAIIIGCILFFGKK